MPKQYLEEFKKQVVACYEEKQSLTYVAKKYNIAASTVARWINDCTIHGPLEEQFTLSEFKQLKRKYTRS